MKIEDQFRVDVPVARAWEVLLDVERIAPCLPGAQLQEIEGDEYRGIVKVKVGPITAQYEGVARIVEADEVARTVVLEAEGRDTRGQGNASATVTAILEPDGAGTVVKIATDLNVTGKVAQFGRGVMADVSGKLLGQFADNLRRDVLAGNAPSGAPTTPPAPVGVSPSPGEPATTGGVRTVDAPEAQPVDLLQASRGALVRRVLPIVGAILALLTLRSLWKRKRRRRRIRRSR